MSAGQRTHAGIRRSATFRPEAQGLVLLCTDGLWNHLPELDAGGHDNVTAAVILHPPPEPSREPGR